MSDLDCIECGGYVSIERLVKPLLCRSCEKQRGFRCTCPMRGAGDAQGCLEVQAYGRTPLLLPGDVLDGVIVVGSSHSPIASVDIDPDPYAECECNCHED